MSNLRVLFYFRRNFLILTDPQGMAITLPHYEDLEWRLDVQLASRALRGQVEPSYFLKLKLLTPGSIFF